MEFEAEAYDGQDSFADALGDYASDHGVVDWNTWQKQGTAIGQFPRIGSPNDETGATPGPDAETWDEGEHYEGTFKFTETDADVASRVLAFLRELALGTVENREVKVPVVGRSEVGKTSLINAMTEGESRLVRVGDRTVGVEQRMYEIKAEVEAGAVATEAGSVTTTAMVKKEITLQLRIFDFAGQREYYLVSQ